MENKLVSTPVKVKSTDDEAGSFEALVSVFGNVDSYGDVMVKGAFSRTLKEWKEEGGEIPFLWSHAMEDPMAYVAGITDAEETEEGLVVRGRFDLDTEQSRQAYKLLKSRRIKEFSFGFLVRDYEVGVKDGKDVRYVKDVDLLEASMTMLGANPSTRLIAVKAQKDDSGARTVGSLSIEDFKTLVAEIVREELENFSPSGEDEESDAASPSKAADEAPEGKSASTDEAAAIEKLSILVTKTLIED